MNEIKTPSLADLRAAGYEVNILHLRAWRVAYNDFPTKKIVVKTVMNTRRAMLITESGESGVLYELLPKGGRTDVTVTDPATGLDFYAYADCCSDENYNKQTGVNKALERVSELVLVCSHHNEAKLDQFVAFVS